MRVTDEQIISALMNTKTNAEAARAVGLSVSTFYRRTKRDSFRVRLARTKAEILARCAMNAQRQAQDALDEIAGIMSDPQNPPQVRLNAADALLRHTLKLTETADFAERLERLERGL